MVTPLLLSPFVNNGDLIDGICLLHVSLDIYLSYAKGRSGRRKDRECGSLNMHAEDPVTSWALRPRCQPPSPAPLCLPLPDRRVGACLRRRVPPGPRHFPFPSPPLAGPVAAPSTHSSSVSESLKRSAPKDPRGPWVGPARA